MLYYNEIKEILAKRGVHDKEEIEKFLNPTSLDFHNPFLLKSMDDAVKRIETAIAEQQTILIYGDYDADGICSVSILFLYLKSRGVEPIVFIPNRHIDGYGLNSDTIEMLSEKYYPDLIITVDTGISAVNEISLLFELGIDCIVTDHHEPSAELPNCIIIDPKLPNQSYPFCELSGAGVVFKLVSALGGLENALQYLDICAISTVGDIVPLLDENRTITTLGLAQINSKNPRPSIKYLKKHLSINTLNSTDISFKIVPRLNASGRMNSCLKCFNFLVSEDENEIKQIFDAIEEDNNERLRQTNESLTLINDALSNIDINETPAIFIRQDNLNLGIIGIVASRLCSTYNRPVFVFSKAEDGTLKASVRSVENINIFNILNKHRNLMLDIGGHSLAGGLTIEEKNYDTLFSLIQNDVKALLNNVSLTNNDSYDIEINDSYINLDFANAINSLEPFGFANPKPVFLIKSNHFSYNNMKSNKHYKIITNTKKEILSFFGNKYIPYFNNDCEKSVYFNIEIDEFNKMKKKAKAIAKKITVESYHFNQNYENCIALHIYYKIISLNTHNKNINLYNKYEEIDKQTSNAYGTLVVSNKEFLNYNKTAFPSPSALSQVVDYSLPIDNASLLLYRNIIFNDGYLFGDEFTFLNKNVFVKNTTFNISNYKLTRNDFADYYTKIRKCLPLESNNFIEILDKLKNITKLNMVKIAIVVGTSIELGFFIYENVNNFNLLLNDKIEKKDLSHSTIYKLFKGEF